MTERRTTEPFETRFADRVQAYTDVATARPIDAFAVSQTAMSPQRATGWSRGRRIPDWRERRIAGVPVAAASLAVILFGVIAVALLGRAIDQGVGTQPTPSASTPGPSAATGGPIADALLHAWERPYAVTPDLDQWPTGSLRLENGFLHVGPEPGDAASRFPITAIGSDTIAVATDSESLGCSIGDVGTYRWSVEGKGTVMTLTAISADACATREEALTGQWVRSDLPPPVDPVAVLAAGTYLTSYFDPFGAPGVSGQLSYTVPERWKVKEDQAGAFLLHQLPKDTASQPSMDTFIHLFTQARLMADYTDGAICGQSSEAPGVGRDVDDIVTAILARPGVVSTPPTTVTIGGYEGQMLDLHLAPTWTGSCQLPDGTIIAMPLLLGPEFERSAGVGLVLDSPLRLTLLDLTGGRTMAIAIYSGGPAEPSQLEEQVAAAMPVVESFEFHPPAP